MKKTKSEIKKYLMKLAKDRNEKELIEEEVKDFLILDIENQMIKKKNDWKNKNKNQIMDYFLYLIEGLEKKESLTEFQLELLNVKIGIDLLKKEIKEKELKEMKIKIERALKSKIIAIDLEFFERAQYIILEVGISIYKNDFFSTKHFILKTKKKYKNGKCVPDNRGNFLFGKSEEKHICYVKNFLEKELKEAKYILGHSIENDLNLIKKRDLKDKIILDTQDLYKFAFDSPSSNKISLENLMKKCDLEAEYLHNAGNDIHYTMLAFKKMSKMLKEN